MNANDHLADSNVASRRPESLGGEEWYVVCSMLGMVLVLAITSALMSGLAAVVYHLWKAPVGYEDQTGFHLIHQIRGSAVVRHPRRDASAGSLKRARANY